MTTYGRHEYTTRTVEFHLPCTASKPVDAGELRKLLSIAAQEYREAHGLPHDAREWDNWLYVSPSDEHICISFTVKKEVERDG